jgi:hypothetical protein
MKMKQFRDLCAILKKCDFNIMTHNIEKHKTLYIFKPPSNQANLIEFGLIVSKSVPQHTIFTRYAGEPPIQSQL